MQIYLPYLWHFTTLRSHSDLFQWQTTIIHIHTLICIHHQNKQQLFAHDVQYENLWHLKSTPSKQFMQVKGKGKNTESNFLVSGDDHQPVLLPALPAESACLQQAGELAKTIRAFHLVATLHLAAAVHAVEQVANGGDQARAEECRTEAEVSRLWGSN